MMAPRCIRLLLATIFILALGVYSSAYAGCKQKKLAGTWSVQAFFVDDLTAWGYWLNCKLKINSKGKYNRRNSICFYDTGDIIYPEGRFQVSSNCVFNPATIYFYTEFDVYLGFSSINLMTAGRSHDVIQGTGDGGTTMPFFMTAIKR